MLHLILLKLRVNTSIINILYTYCYCRRTRQHTCVLSLTLCSTGHTLQLTADRGRDDKSVTHTGSIKSERMTTGKHRARACLIFPLNINRSFFTFHSAFFYPLTSRPV